ncbi:ABC transporter permease [Microbacterium invictum]|uniref:ABC transporter permease n=1 Tax=Microbacterium invictum TaxID=515415 RepID=A0ABZ0V7M6_9MICO|nr:ABC transporter permease [Microbacterium invictum]WQB69626.1 ABC transporter permease [Microbacterium invictum]
MNAQRIATIIRLELTQRIRSVAWYVLLGIFAVLLLGVTALTFISVPRDAFQQAGSTAYSIIVFFVLLLVVLVSPTLSGNAINGDRDAATLAPVQVTLATTADIIAGKFFAAWITGLAFLAVSAPFLIFAAVFGEVRADVLLVSLVILIIEVAVVAGLGVALSGILARPLFSVAVTYLTVAALVVGTPIAFGLVGTAFPIEIESRQRFLEPVYDPSMQVPEECMTADPGATEPLPQCVDVGFGPGVEEPDYRCGPWTTSTYTAPRFDRVWWLLSANPFVILADATPTVWRDGYPVDAFGALKVGVRTAQIAPEAVQEYDGCDTATGVPGGDFPTSEEQVEGTVPSWFVGLGVQLALLALLMWRAAVRTHTPSRRLPPGTRIA